MDKSSSHGRNQPKVSNSQLQPEVSAAGGEDHEVEDPVEKLLNKTGCLDKHYKVQECIGEFHDWRKCQQEVENFRLCIEQHKKQQANTNINSSSS